MCSAAYGEGDADFELHHLTGANAWHRCAQLSNPSPLPPPTPQPLLTLANRNGQQPQPPHHPPLPLTQVRPRHARGLPARE